MITLLGYMGAWAAGLVLGLLGGGGSILSVPILVYAFSIPASVATVYSLFVIGCTSLVGVVSYFRMRQLDITVGLIFLVPSMLGVWVSRHLILPAIPTTLFEFSGWACTKDRFILLFFSVFMLLAAYSMLRKKRPAPDGDRSLKNSKKGYFGLGLWGAAAGLLMGLVGAGGGFLIVPVLTGLGKLEMKKAIGTSLLVITVSSLFGFVSDIFGGRIIEWGFLGGFTLLSLFGVVIGVRMGKKVGSGSLRTLFGMLVLTVAVLMVVRELFFFQ